MIWLDAVEQAQSIRRREASSVDLVREYLERIDRLDPALHSYVTVDASGALEAAEKADRQIARGPHGCRPAPRGRHLRQGRHRCRWLADDPLLEGLSLTT